MIKQQPIRSFPFLFVSWLFFSPQLKSFQRPSDHLDVPVFLVRRFSPISWRRTCCIAPTLNVFYFPSNEEFPNSCCLLLPSDDWFYAKVMWTQVDRRYKGDLWRVRVSISPNKTPFLDVWSRILEEIPCLKFAAVGTDATTSIWRGDAVIQTIKTIKSFIYFSGPFFLADLYFRSSAPFPCLKSFFFHFTSFFSLRRREITRYWADFRGRRFPLIISKIYSAWSIFQLFYFYCRLPNIWSKRSFYRKKWE